MLQENIKALRKAHGVSQEELAIKLNVVRQTVSKWEKGLSVPDANLLIHIAEIFDVPVSELLGATTESLSETHISDVAEQLSRINEQLAIKNQRARRVWKAVLIALISFVSFFVFLALLGTLLFAVRIHQPESSVQTTGYRDDAITQQSEHPALN